MNKPNYLLAALFILSCVATGRAQTADEIVQKHIAAIGGADAWRKVNSLRMTGSIIAQGQEINVVVSAVENKGARQDIMVGGMKGYAYTTTTDGWTYFPFAGQQKPEALTADQVKSSQDELDIQGLVDYKQKGEVIEYLGKEDFEGTECYKLKVTRKDSTEKTLYFDPSDYYLIREVKKQIADGKEADVPVNFSNFQKLPEGITVPMTLGTPGGDVTMKKVEVNPKLDDSLFKQ